MNIYYSLILFKIRLIFSNYKFRLIHLNICVHFLELYLREYTNFTHQSVLVRVDPLF